MLTDQTTVRPRRARGSGCVREVTQNGRTRYYPIVRVDKKPKWLAACHTRHQAEAVLEQWATRAAEVAPQSKPPTRRVTLAPTSVATVRDYVAQIYLPHIVGFDVAAYERGLGTECPAKFADAFIDPESSRWKNKLGTREDHARIITNTILPCLGDKSLELLEPADVWCMTEGRVDGYAPKRAGSRTASRVNPKTALNELNVFSNVCRDAMARGYRDTNPTDAVRYLLLGQWNVKSAASRVR